MIKTAIMIDGAFYRKRAYYFWGEKSPADRAQELYRYCQRHIRDERAGAEHFILDPMRSTIKDDLFEHIDGMRTKAPKEPHWTDFRES